jgi:hypothetical protein
VALWTSNWSQNQAEPTKSSDRMEPFTSRISTIASFDAIDHERLIQFLEHRIGDQRILRLIRKWLHAGVIEEGEWSATTAGAPQGAVISPLLSNVYLHHVCGTCLPRARTIHVEVYTPSPAICR